MIGGRLPLLPEKMVYWPTPLLVEPLCHRWATCSNYRCWQGMPLGNAIVLGNLCEYCHQTLPETIFFGLCYWCRQWEPSFIQFDKVSFEMWLLCDAFCVTAQSNGHYAIPRNWFWYQSEAWMWLPISNNTAAWAYYIRCTVSKLWQITDQILAFNKAYLSNNTFKTTKFGAKKLSRNNGVTSSSISWTV